MDQSPTIFSTGREASHPERGLRTSNSSGDYGRPHGGVQETNDREIEKRDLRTPGEIFTRASRNMSCCRPPRTPGRRGPAYVEALDSFRLRSLQAVVASCPHAELSSVPLVVARDAFAGGGSRRRASKLGHTTIERVATNM